MENTVIKDIVLDKKMEGYNFENHNFQASQELTVTITLDEYRDLVGKAATRKADIDKAESDKYARETEIKQLKNENNALKTELYELKKKLEALTSEPCKVEQQVN